MAQIIQLRRDYSSNWTLANPVLAQGELGIEFDNYNVKIGNGLSSWNELPYGLGTASVPVHTHSYAGTGITTASTSGINIAGTLNSSGLSLGIPAWLTTYSSAAGGGDWTAATVSGTDMLVSTGAGTNTIYYPKYITTAADINHSHTQYLTTAMVSDAGSNFIGTTYTSHTHQYQSTGNYLTTAALSNHTHDAYIATSLSSGFLTTAALSNHTHNYAGVGTSATNASITLNSNGLAISVAAPGAAAENNYISLYGNTSNASTVSGSSILLSAGNNITLAISNGSVKIEGASVGDTLNAMHTSERGNYFYTSNNTFLTTAALTNHTHGSISIASTAGTDFTYSSASNGMSFSIPKWITTYAAGGGEIAISAGGSSADLASVVFSNGSGVSFGLNGSTITATVKTDYQSSGVYLTTAAESNHTHSQYINTSISSNFLTTAALSDHTHSNLYIALGNSTYYQSSNLSSVFQTTGAYLTTAANSTHTHDYAVSTHTHNQYINTSVSGSFQLTANNSLSLDTGYTTHTHLYQSTGAYLTTAAQSNQVVNSFNGSTGQISFVTGSGMSTTTNASTLTFGLRSDISTAWSGQTTANSSRVIAFNGSSGQISFVTGSGMSTTTNASTLTFGLRSDISTAWSGQTTANQSRVVVINGLSNSISFATGSSLSSSINGSTITFGLASNITTALQSAGAYLTTAAVSDHTHSNLYIALANSTAYQTSVLSGTFQTTGAYLTTAAVSNHTHDYQSTGAYLTTAMASNAGSNFAGINSSTQSTSGSALAITYNTSGLSLGIPAWITAGAAGGGDWSISSTAGTDIVISTGAATNTLYQPAYITTYAGGAGSIYAGDFISLSTVGGSTSISVTNTSSFTSLAMNTSERANYFYTSNNTFLTTAAQVSHTHGNISTASTGGTAFTYSSASNGMSFSIPAWITTYVAGAGVAIAAAGATVTNSTVVFSNSNGVSFGGNGSTITAQIAGVGTVYFSDGSGVTWGSSTNGVSTTITASVNAGGGGTSIVPGSYLSSSLNGSTLSLSVTGLQATSATSAITASAMNTSERVNYFYTSNNTFLTTAMLSNASSVFAGVGETTSGAVSLTVDTAGVNISVPAIGYLSLVNSNGYTWSTSVNGVSTAIWMVIGHTA